MMIGSGDATPRQHLIWFQVSSQARIEGGIAGRGFFGRSADDGRRIKRCIIIEAAREAAVALIMFR
jgi:hypothetical protein